MHFYPFAVNLDRCNGSCITIDDLSSRMCVPNKTGEVNLSAFNMIRRIMMINVDESTKFQENIMYAKKNFTWNPST